MEKFENKKDKGNKRIRKLWQANIMFRHNNSPFGRYIEEALVQDISYREEPVTARAASPENLRLAAE